MTSPLDSSILCRAALELPSTATGEMMFMPGGLQSINPVEGGIGKPINVLVDPEGARQIEAQRSQLAAKGKRPFFDFNHEDRAASFWPTEFFWRPDGIHCRGEWSKSGKEGVEGKEWRGFSPVFHVDNKLGNPARIVCRAGASPNMGGLVNEPAFHAITALWAKHNSAGAAGENQNQPANTAVMTEQELAALRAKNLELQTEIDALKAKESALKAKNETDATVASEIRVKEADIRANAAKLENEALKAKNKEQGDAIKARNETDAKAAVADAVKRGAIPAQDTATQTMLVCKATEDPAFLGAIKAMQGNGALSTRITPATAASGVQIVGISGLEAVSAYAAVVAKNAAIRDRFDPQKKILAAEAAAIYASEMKGNEDRWMTVNPDRAIKAADVASASVGTLAGTLVLQRNLPFLRYEYPMLQTMFTDFSDSVGLWQQTEMTRIVVSPAVTEYDGSLDSNGRPKGFVVVTPAQTVDVPITLTKHVGIPMIFGVQTLASTVRNLFEEQSAGAINALGGYFVDMATALMTPANFNAYAQITDASCGTTSGSTAITLATTAGVYPSQEISGTGIPIGAHIASVTDATHAVIDRELLFFEHRSPGVVFCAAARFQHGAPLFNSCLEQSAGTTTSSSSTSAATTAPTPAVWPWTATSAGKVPRNTSRPCRRSSTCGPTRRNVTTCS